MTRYISLIFLITVSLQASEDARWTKVLKELQALAQKLPVSKCAQLFYMLRHSPVEAHGHSIMKQCASEAYKEHAAYVKSLADTEKREENKMQAHLVSEMLLPTVLRIAVTSDSGKSWWITVPGDGSHAPFLMKRFLEGDEPRLSKNGSQ